MRICLFDWNEGGHHAEVAKAFARALHPGADVVFAAPEATLRSAGEIPAAAIALPTAKPRPGIRHGRFSPQVSPTKSELAEQELDLVGEVVADIEPDHLVLLWADPVLRWLLRRPPLPTAVSLYIAFAQLHYPRRYRTLLGPKDLAGALYKELNILRWSRRRDAHALFALDSLAADRWSHYPGTHSVGLDETPLNYVPETVSSSEKRGCILFGQMDPRKGLDRIATAVSEGCQGLEMKIYGKPVADYEGQLAEEIKRMRDGGVLVDARLARIPYEEALDSIARSRAALLSFGWVPAGSRVLLEAAAAGTPVIGSTKGAVGHLIRTHGLGVTVDPDDPGALRNAIQELTADPAAPERYGEGLRSYAKRLNGDSYRRGIRRAFGLPQNE
jgi:glycosyltransferase involved in cell wall biosynthesis